MRLCAVSVDLDEIPNYHAIHAIAEPSGASATLVYDVALDRLDDFARSRRIPLTLFCIATDLERERNARALARLGRRGHEMANHSLDHLYDLTRRDHSDMCEQVSVAAERIRAATGESPTGFRAPGYTVTDELLDAVREVGAEYDSSVFPSPPYYAAKALALARLRVLGRRSRSVLDTPLVLAAPTEPYRIGRPYWKRGDGLLELPISVTRRLRIPFIGTFITFAGPDRARWLARGVVGAPLVNLELHGIDVLDAEDGLRALENVQPDVRVSRERKLSSLDAALTVLADAGYSFVRLDEAARAFA